MKIYLAHNYAAREWLSLTIVPKLAALGHTVTSRWLTGQHDVSRTDADRQRFAEEDLRDIIDADTLVLFAEQFGTRRGLGKYVELGFAIADDRMKVFIVGPRQDESVFYFARGITRCETFEEFLVKYAAL